jgi:hypothetical protein
MKRTTALLLLTALSLAGLSLMHLVHGSYHHDSFAYLVTAEHFLGRTPLVDARRVTLFTFLLMPFAGRPALLYLVLTAVAWAGLFVVSRIVAAFNPRSSLHYLLFIIPSYATYLLTSVLQEGTALLLLGLAVYVLLKKRYPAAMALMALAVFVRPAMSAMAPGFLAALLYHKRLYDEVRGGESAVALVRREAGGLVRDALIYGLVFLAACVVCAAPLLLLTSDPLAAFKILSGVYIRDNLMRLAFPALWFSLFGVLGAPLILYAFYALAKARRAVFAFFALMFLPYLAAVWYQANIRYLLFLIIPTAVAVSQLTFSPRRPVVRAAALALCVLSFLYPFGPLVYYYDYGQGRRVLGVSAEPYIWFDSEYKGRQYRELRRLIGAKEPTAAERALLDSCRGTPMLDFLRRHPESW